MTTLLLDPATSDLVLDTAGNIAVASDPYATSQDVSSALRMTQGEGWFDTTVGVPYWSILGQLPPLGLIKSAFVEAAMTVPAVKSAICNLSSISGRTLSGQVIVTTASGTTPVGF